MSAAGACSAWLHGGGQVCDRTDPPPSRPFRLVLLGAPGVGKGTQAEMLSERLKACQLSTGEIFRAAKAAEESTLSPAMLDALGYMKRGALVPDDTVIALVRERVTCLKCPYGFLLDGFPRTVPQAEALESLLHENALELDAVLNYELPMEEAVARLSGRRTCPVCKTTYHIVTKPPKRSNVCDKCGVELYQREDDRPESIRVRLEAYEESTAPLTDYFKELGILINISAMGTPQQVFERTMKFLDERRVASI